MRLGWFRRGSRGHGADRAAGSGAADPKCPRLSGWFRRRRWGDPPRPRHVPEAVARLSFVGVLLVAGFVGLRSVLPPALKNKALQQAAALEREKAREPKYAGAHACGECHGEQYEIRRNGYHRNVSCETCHGPARGHAESPVEVTPPAPRSRSFCPTCHAYDLSRPVGFPQINPIAHNPLKPCITCHNPHDPKPPTVPSACAACHAEIERTKAFSPHVLLDCTTCHSTPEEHKVTPRTARVSKPSRREFCGQCHSQDSKHPDTPKIDIASHGEGYLCWQCHYPHMPELE